MKTIILLLTAIIPSLLTAQVIERETAIYNFTKGEVSVVLQDTISPEQAHHMVDSLGLKIIHQSMRPVSVLWGNRMDSANSEILRSNPAVSFFESKPMFSDTSAVRTPPDMTAERRREMLERMMTQYTTRIEFQYNITEDQALTILQSLDMEVAINPNNIRSGTRVVTVEVPVGEENRYMELLHRQAIVKNTARIAIPDYE
jgi:hypothetical protein